MVNRETLTIEHVVPGSVEQRVGICVGSKVVAVNSVPVADLTAFFNILASSVGGTVCLELAFPAPAPLRHPPPGVGPQPTQQTCPPGFCPYCFKVHNRQVPASPGFVYCSHRCSKTAISSGWGHAGQPPQGAAGTAAQTVTLCPQCKSRPVSVNFRHCSKACAIAAMPPAGPNDCRFCHSNGKIKAKHKGSDYCSKGCKSRAEQAGWVAGLSPAEIAKGSPPAHDEARVTGYHGTKATNLPSVSPLASVQQPALQTERICSTVELDCASFIAVLSLVFARGCASGQSCDTSLSHNGCSSVHTRRRS